MDRLAIQDLIATLAFRYQRMDCRPHIKLDWAARWAYCGEPLKQYIVEYMPAYRVSLTLDLRSSELIWLVVTFALAFTICSSSDLG